MSPRLRWPGGRRAAEREGPGPTDEPARPTCSPGDLSETGEQVAERLRAAAAGGRDGVLHVVGEPGGLVYLTGGRVSLVQTPVAPGVDLLVLHRARGRAGRLGLLDAVRTSEGRDTVTAEAHRAIAAGDLSPVELDVVHQQAVADAAFVLFGTDGTTFVRSRFLRGERPWTRLDDPLTVDALIAEAARRRRQAADRADGVLPTCRPVRTDRLPVTSVRLTAAQWDLVVHADGSRTTTDLAWMLGRGVFATILEVSSLLRLGLLELSPGRRDPAAAAPPASVAPAADAGGGTPTRPGEGDATSLVPVRGGPHG